MTFAEIGKVLGITATRVKQIEKSAMEKIRMTMKERGLTFDYWEVDYDL